jgi:glyoxylase-like metal-dependent hydrolase (beta-lactamase superfamily II)
MLGIIAQARPPVLSLRAVVLLAMIACAPGHASAQSVRLERIAPDVFLQRGAIASPSAENAGRVANLGVIVAASGVTVINTGTSVHQGESLLASINRLTDKPILLAINTQASPDQVLGNGAFALRGIPVLAHRETDLFMVRTCETCLRNLVAETGDLPLRGTQLSRPTWLIDASFTLEIAGRSIDILYFGWTVHAGSLAVYDRASGVLFAGDLASFGVIPDVQHARLAGWLDALQRLEKLDARLVVPGRGRVDGPERFADVRRYLTSLAAIVERGYRRGLSLGEITQHSPLPEFEPWVLYANRHPRNVHFIYLALEQEELRR